MARRKNRWLFWLLVVVAIVAVYAVVGFFVVPPIARNQITERGTEALGREVSLERVTFNPFTFDTSLVNLQVAGREADALVSWDEARANFNPVGSLFSWRWNFGDVALIAPHVRLAIDEQGRLNIADLFQQPSPETEEEPPGIAVETFTVQEARLNFTDRSQGEEFSTTLAPVSFTLVDFTTEPDGAGQYQLSGSTGRGETFTWTGSMAVSPFSSSGSLEFENLSLPAYMPFLARFLHGQLQSGQGSITGSYNIRLGGDRTATLRGVTVQVRDLALALPESGEPAIALPALDVQIPSADLFAPSAQVERMALSGLSVRATRRADGTLDLTALIPTNPRSEAGEDPPTGAGGTPPDIQIASITLGDGAIEFTDESAPAAVAIRADQITLTATGASSALDQEVEVDFSLRWQEGGTLQGSGHVQPQPFQTGLAIEVAGVDLASLGPYLRDFFQAEIVEAQLEANGRMGVVMPTDGPFQLSWSGPFGINNLATRQAEGDQALISWAQLRAEHADISTGPLRLDLQQVTWQEPAVHLVLEEGGGFNLATAFGGTGDAQEGSTAAAGKQEFAEGAEPPPDEEDPSQGPPMNLAVDTITLSEGRLTFLDRTIAPEFTTDISSLNGSISGLSSAEGNAATVELSGVLAEATRVSLQGTVNVVSDHSLRPSDLQLDLGNLELERLEPYAAHYLGYRIRDGVASANFEYAVRQDSLSGSNRLVLEEVELGESVESPSALNIPIQLALAVLRDSEGRIELDIPVSGELGSPQFSLSGVVTDAFQNILTRAATAPFSMLSSLFGAPEDELRRIDFPPGSADLPDETTTQLDTLTQVLQDRPGLALTIHWAATPEADEEELRRRQLEELIQQEKARLAAATREGAEAPDAARGGEISDAAAIRALFAQRFPDEVPEDVEESATTATPAGDDDENGETERRSILSSLWRWISGPRDPARSDDVEPDPSDEPEVAVTAPEMPDPETMRERLLESIELTDESLDEVARSRAANVKESLVSGGVPEQRVTVAEQAGVPEDATPATGTGRVFFSLDVAESFAAAPDR